MKPNPLSPRRTDANHKRVTLDVPQRITNASSREPLVIKPWGRESQRLPGFSEGTIA